MSNNVELKKSFPCLLQGALSKDLGLAGLANHVSSAVWRGTSIAPVSQAVVPTGFPMLDSQLPGGGWPCRSLTELLQAEASFCEWRLLAHSLQQLVMHGGHILMVGPPKRPHAPGLSQLGIPAKSLIWFAAETPAERLWTSEQLIKSSPQGVILIWLPQVRSEQLRRLQVHAQSCDCPVFVFRPEQTQYEASAAPLRLTVAFLVDWALQVRILKRKGGHHESLITLPSIPSLLFQVLTPRLLRPSQFISKTEPSYVNSLGCAADQTSNRHFASH